MITPAGGSLEKVRLCSLTETHYAHFVFQIPQGEVSLFLRRAPGEDTYQPGDVHDRSNGLEVAGFSSQSFVGAVVGQDGLVAAREIASQESRSCRTSEESRQGDAHETQCMFYRDSAGHDDRR